MKYLGIGNYVAVGEPVFDIGPIGGGIVTVVVLGGLAWWLLSRPSGRGGRVGRVGALGRRRGSMRAKVAGGWHRPVPASAWHPDYGGPRED